MQNKNCNRCKATQYRPGQGYSCTLGYKVNTENGTPLEDCPKPLIYLDYIELLHDMQSEGRSGSQ